MMKRNKQIVNLLKKLYSFNFNKNINNSCIIYKLNTNN